MNLFQTKCQLLTPRDCFLKDMFVLAQAWNKTHTAIRRHDWYADVLGDDYPSDTFRVLKNSEMRQFGEHRTGRLVLEAWDRQVGSGDLL